MPAYEENNQRRPKHSLSLIASQIRLMSDIRYNAKNLGMCRLYLTVDNPTRQEKKSSRASIHEELRTMKLVP